MNEREITKKTSIAKHSLLHGFLLGLAIIAIQLVFRSLSPESGRLNLIITIVVLLFGLHYCTTKWRDGYKEGFISYSQALGYGTLTIFFSSLILGVFVFLTLNFTDPEVLELALDQAKLEILQNQPNITDSELEMAISITRFISKPTPMAILTTAFYTFLGFLGSLITAAIAQRKKPLFDFDQT